MSFSADITNIGGSGVTNVAVTFDVQDASGTSVFSETVTQASLSAGMSSTFTAMGTFVPSSTGSLTVNYDVTMTETDSDLSNNSLSLVDIFMITDSTHAKDNGNTISQVGIGAPGLIGHIYEFFNTDSISSVSIISSNNTAGDVLTAQIFATSGGVPTGAPIATSQSINYNGDTAETEYIFGFATPVAVDSGAAYFVAIEETTNNISVSYALDIFTPNTGFFSTDNGASWTSFDLVGFPISMYIRPNVTGVMPPVNTSQLKEFEGAFDIMPNPTRGLTTLNVEIENAQDIQVAVFDVTGKLVQAFTDANVTTRQYTIDLSNQTDGVYLVRLITNGQIVTKRVILNK